MVFRYLHRPHRSREIASRTHPIPQLIEVIRLRHREPLDADRVHTRRPTVGPNLLPRPIDEAFVDLKRLHLRLRSHPRLLPRGIDSHRVDLVLTVDCPVPSLQPHSRPALSGRQVLLFHTSACDELTPPIHRAPPGPHAGRSPAEDAPRRARLCPGPPHTVRFRCRRSLFRCVSSGSHTFVFSSHTCPALRGTSTATLTTRLLTDAACGGLGSPPARRTRRAHLHHWYSTLHAGDLLHRHHSTSGHTWGSTSRPEPVTCDDRRFTLQA